MFQLHNPKHPLLCESRLLIQMLFPKSHFLFSLIPHPAARHLCCFPSAHTWTRNTFRQVFMRHKLPVFISGPSRECKVGGEKKKRCCWYFFFSSFLQGQQLLAVEHHPQTPWQQLTAEPMMNDTSHKGGSEVLRAALHSNFFFFFFLPVNSLRCAENLL